MRCPYEVLGLPRGAPEENVKKAYRKLAMQFHPDKTNNDPDKTEQFRQIKHAYDTIVDPQEPDEFAVPRGAAGFPPFSDAFFAAMRSGFAFASDASTDDPDTIEVPMDENDVRYGVVKKVEFESTDKCAQCEGRGTAGGAVQMCVACGGRGVVQISDVVPGVVLSLACGACSGSGTTHRSCTTCDGRGSVFRKRAYEIRVPQGVPNAHVVLMKAKGGYDPNTNRFRDLRLRFTYAAFSQLLRVVKRDVHIDVEVDVTDLMRGFKRLLQVFRETYMVQTHGYVDVNIPHRLVGEGLPSCNTPDVTGDLVLHFKVTFPPRLPENFTASAPPVGTSANKDDVQWVRLTNANNVDATTSEPAEPS
jgi:molecular chaperone DnaJ